MAKARSLSEFQKAFPDEASCVAFVQTTLAGRFHLPWCVGRDELQTDR